MRKPRSDSKLDALPEHQQIELRDGLLADWGLEDARSWLASECGVSVSLSTVSAFFKRHCAPLIRERRQIAAMKAEAIGGLADTVDWDAASIEKLRQMVFEFMADPTADLEETERMFRLLLKRKDQEISERQLRLREDAAAAAKAKLADLTKDLKSRGGLTEETLARIEEAAGLL